MGAGQRALGLALAAAFSLGARAGADPLLPEPVPARKLHFRTKTTESGWAGEARILAIGLATRLATYPDRRLGTKALSPQLAAVRVTGFATWAPARLTLVVSADGAEVGRPFLEDEVAPFASALVDDLYARWRPVRPANLVVGRSRVPWSRYRHFDEADLPASAVPFVVDRVAPDRRWGVSLYGDLGAMSYAAGVYEDLDAVEPRPRPEEDDPSWGGQLAAAAHVEWTPRAPMFGSNPPGDVRGALGPAPTPRADPWFATARVSLGLGALWRRSDAGASRLDVAFSAHVKWQALAVLAEVMGSQADGLGAHATVMLTPLDALVLATTAEWDEGAGAAGEWAVHGAMTYSVRKDRRSKVGLHGWIRRGSGREPAYDALVVLLQASL